MNVNFSTSSTIDAEWVNEWTRMNEREICSSVLFLQAVIETTYQTMSSCHPCRQGVFTAYKQSSGTSHWLIGILGRVKCLTVSPIINYWIYCWKIIVLHLKFLGLLWLRNMFFHSICFCKHQFLKIIYISHF